MSAAQEEWVMVVLDPGTPAEIINAATRLVTTAASFLRSYDPEAHDGRGDIVLTESLEHAKRFASFEAVMEEWKRVPACHPIRASDGKPNRPLSAYTISPRMIR